MTKKAASSRRKPSKSKTFALLERGERLLSEGGNVRQALTALEAARDSAKTVDPILLPQILYWLAQAYMMADDLPAVESAAEDLITLGHTARNPEIEADGYLLFAKAQYQSDRAPVALTALDCAEALYREANHDLGLAHTFRNRGDALYRLGRHEAALQAYATAEPLYIKEEEVQGLGNTLAAKGDLLFFLGRNDEALFFLTEAQKLLEASGNVHAVGACLGKLGALHSFVGRTKEALRAYNKAYRIFRSIGDERSLADTAYRRGELLFRIGRNDRAIRDLREAVRRHETSGDIHGRANALNSLAEVLLQMGQFEDCLALASEAEALFAEIDDPMGRGYAVQNLAWAAYQLGRDTEALRRSEEGVSLAGLRGDKLGEANALATRARILSRLGRDEEALQTYFDAAALYRSIGDLVGLSDMQSSSARIFRRQGDHPAALAACDEAERLSREADEALGLANALATRGQVFFAMGRVDEGRAALLEARGAYAAANARWNVPQLDMELARLLVAAGRLDDAETAALDCLTGLDVLRDFDPSARTHADLIEQFADALVVLLDILRERGRINEMVAAMEARRAWTLGWLASEGVQAKSRPSRAKASSVRSKRAARPSSAKEDSLLDGSTITNRLQEVTRDGSIVLTWYPLSNTRSDRVGSVLCLPGKEPRFVEIAIEHDRLASAVTRVLELGRTRQDTGWDKPLRELGTLVFSGAVLSEYSLDGRRNHSEFPSLSRILETFPNSSLTIVPQGLFGLVPWGALRVSPERYLIEDRTVSLLPRVASTPQTGERTRNTHRQAFCFGLGSDSLHWTEREAEAITSFLSSHDYQVSTHLGRNASSQSFAELVQGRNLIHLATHAVFNAEDPFQSFLEFGASASHRVQLVDVLGLDLAGSTAVLSACSTAETDWKRVFDPVSLTSAFLAAGCHEVLGTLWAVDDSSTAVLMSELYRLVLDESLSWREALRRVQLAALRGETLRPPGVSSARGPFAQARVSTRKTSLTSPLRWGAFTLSRAM